MRFILFYMLFFSCCAFRADAQGDPFKWHLDLPYVAEQQKITQQLFYTSDSARPCDLSVSCYRMNERGDSDLIYTYRHKKVLLSKGAQSLKLVFSGDNDSAKFHPEVRHILLSTNAMPAGQYHLRLTTTIHHQTREYSFLKFIDSSLSVQSDARKRLNDAYVPEKRVKVLGIDLGKTSTGTAAKNVLASADKAMKNADRAFQARGLSTVHRSQNGKEYVDVFYKEWFVGYYEIKAAEDITNVVEKERKQLVDGVSTMAKDGLENIETIFTQVKKLNEENEQREVQGNVSVAGHMSNGQEEYSETDNNYYELRGELEAPIMDIPVSIEGYYTSQDRKRQAKASYVRIHYDTEKAKEELLKLINGYNDKYEQTASKGKGLDGVYKSYLARLEGEKDRMLNDLKKETGLNDIGNLGLDTAGLRRQLTDSLTKKVTDTSGATKDSSSGLKKTTAGALKIKDSVEQLYNKAMKQYEKIQALEKNVAKYKALSEQYKNSNYYDSVLAYDKMKGLENGDEKSYKELAKTAGNLLPDGKFKKFVTGLTNIDAGIISKEVSSYTLSGQTMKGIDVGYDLGFCETGFTYGRVEYVSRDGTVDKYSGYSGRVSFKPGKKQKASLIYYGYMPSQKMMNEDEFFRNMDIAVPGFRKPVHIVSGTYEGAVRKVNVAAEVATSFRNTAEYGASDTKINDKLAYKLQADGDIPNTNINLLAGVEHSGKAFENNSLPVSMSGTDRYRVAAKGVFFKNFLTLGVEYNYLEQQSFQSKGGNSKWGFEIKTTSKRYPSVSLSYKPFSTFRSYSDTLNIPQRPLIGEVWTGKVSYQIKRKEYVLRITGVYNKNTSVMDTVGTNNTLVQLNCIYTRGKMNLMLNMGNTSMGGTELPAAHTDTKFLGISGGYKLSKQWSVMAGQDIGVADFGFSRYGANLGCVYRMKKTPLSVRANCRYNTYRMTETEVWKQLVSGSLEIAWQFKFKLDEKGKK